MLSGALKFDFVRGIRAAHILSHKQRNRGVSKVVLEKQRVPGPQGEIDSREEEREAERTKGSFGELAGLASERQK